MCKRTRVCRRISCYARCLWSDSRTMRSKSVRKRHVFVCHWLQNVTSRLLKFWFALEFGWTHSFGVTIFNHVNVTIVFGKPDSALNPNTCWNEGSESFKPRVTSRRRNGNVWQTPSPSSHPARKSVLREKLVWKVQIHRRIPARQ